jgi:hypothetical protein
MIAPTARLNHGHEAPSRKRRHGQHATIIQQPGPARRTFTADRTTRNVPRLDNPPGIGHPGTGHGAGRRTGSTPDAANPGP